MSDTEEFMTVHEVAAFMRIHPETVRSWLRDRRFPNAYRLGRRGGWRVPREDVRLLIAQMRDGADRD